MVLTPFNIFFTVANKFFGTVKNDSVSKKGRERKRKDNIYTPTKHMAVIHSSAVSSLSLLPK